MLYNADMEDQAQVAIMIGTHYQLEVLGPDGWEAMAQQPAAGDDLRPIQEWFNQAQVYHRSQAMRMVKVTREELFSRKALD
jgi:hypothetical protein